MQWRWACIGACASLAAACSAGPHEREAPGRELKGTRSALGTTCDTTTSPSADWRTDLASFLSSQTSPPGTFCFAPGTYDGYLQIFDASVRLQATEEGRSTLTNSAADTSGAVLSIDNSRVSLAGLQINVDMPIDPVLYAAKGVERTAVLITNSAVDIADCGVSNGSEYPDGAIHPVDHALVAKDASVTIAASNFAGRGKNVVVADDWSELAIHDSKVDCYYFCVESDDNARIISSNTTYTMYDPSRGTVAPHAAVWVTGGSMSFDHDTFDFQTGWGFISGDNTGDPSDAGCLDDVTDGAAAPTAVRLNSVKIQPPEQMAAWMPTAPSYHNLRLYLTDDDYDAALPYQCIGGGTDDACVQNWQRGSLQEGMQICVRNSAQERYRQIPVTPASPEALLFESPEGTGGFLRAQVWNQDGGLDSGFDTTHWVDWTAEPTGEYAGWLDPSDRFVSGDFLGSGEPQLLFLNTDHTPDSGMIRIDTYDADGGRFTLARQLDWTTPLASAYAGWIDANDRLVAGDFLGHGTTQLLFISTDSSAGGGVMRLDEYDPTSQSFVNRAWENWDSVPPGFFSGWMDANDRIAAGPIFKNGQDQLLFFNTDPLRRDGALLFMEIDFATLTFVARNQISWSLLPGNWYNGFTDTNDRFVLGDFRGDGSAQLLLINVDQGPDNVARWLQRYDRATNSLVTLLDEPWERIPANSDNGWLDTPDRTIAIRKYW